MRVFLDANILFSAAHRTENSVLVFFRLAELGACELIASAFAVDEARRNIARKHAARLSDLEALLAHLGICEEATAEGMHWARSVGLPDKDAAIERILAPALRARPKPKQ